MIPVPEELEQDDEGEDGDGEEEGGFVTCEEEEEEDEVSFVFTGGTGGLTRWGGLEGERWDQSRWVERGWEGNGREVGRHERTNETNEKS